eukprot:6204742-Amphidinium_carterae.1
MEENQCSAVVKPSPHKSWIMSLHAAHGARMVQISRSQINASLSSALTGAPQEPSAAERDHSRCITVL